MGDGDRGRGKCVCVVVGEIGEERMLREEKKKEGGKVLCFSKFSCFIIMKRDEVQIFSHIKPQNLYPHRIN